MLDERDVRGTFWTPVASVPQTGLVGCATHAMLKWANVADRVTQHLGLRNTKFFLLLFKQQQLHNNRANLDESRLKLKLSSHSIYSSS